MTRTTRLLVTGIVQGIGFRPFCARLAALMQLGGSVRNSSRGVEIILYGPGPKLEEYRARLASECPVLAYIQKIAVLADEPAPDAGPGTFSILESEKQDENVVLIPPDIAVCDDCLREMLDPGDRRYGYPFINCTNCGPRFSIIESLPYDRPATTMRAFEMCGECRNEYENPADRRYHAQPIACRECGPSLWLSSPSGQSTATGEKALEQARSLLLSGAVMGVKGLGGFHIACLPEDGPLKKLRSRKNRPHKPFAIMVRDETEAEKLVFLTRTGRRLLKSPRAPIVVLKARPAKGLSSLLAPGQSTLGIMLPYTPLHHLLLRDTGALVMTSANISNAPIVSDNEEARRDLGSVVDWFLFHDRPIHMKIDDSVVSAASGRAIMLRRARGFVPHPVITSNEMPQILAAGGEMKSTFAFTRGNTVLMSQPLGDLKHLETSLFYRRALRHFADLYGLEPRFMVRDAHPQYISGRLALELIDRPEEILEVQHHHAHMSACLLDAGFEGPAIGLILDGTGYGTDGSIWGGEFLCGDASGYERLGSFRTAPLPGGEKSILEPWRFALALLSEAFGHSRAIEIGSSLWPHESGRMETVLDSATEAPLTSSCGRLFDAVSSILGIRERVSYDGQAAMELESAASGNACPAPFSVTEENGFITLDWIPAIRSLVESDARRNPSTAASAFHLGLASALADIAVILGERTGLSAVALSGGVWQNMRLLSLTIAFLKQRGLRPVLHRNLSPNDECVSAGQAAIGAARWNCYS